MIRRYLMAPGPTPVPERALEVMGRQLIHHRGPEFKAVFGEARAGLRWLFETASDVLMLTCSGTGAFEAAMTNFTSRGDKVLAVGGGKFGERWAEVGRAFGMDVHLVELKWGEHLTSERLASELQKHRDVTMVTLSASETSTGVFHPVRELAEVVQEHSAALFAVDGITAVGVHEIKMDAWGIDVLVSGSQKALGIPPGLGFLAASERAWERAEQSDHPRFYFDLLRERAAQVKNQTAFTPAISVVLALREVLALMQEEGRTSLLARHTRNGAATRAGMEALGFELLASRPSNAVTAAKASGELTGAEIVRRMREDEGITIAGGQGHLKEALVRIGHIGFFDSSDIVLTLAALERVIGEEEGRAVRAAQNALIRAAAQPEYGRGKS